MQQDLPFLLAYTGILGIPFLTSRCRSFLDPCLAALPVFPKVYPTVPLDDDPADHHVLVTSAFAKQGKLKLKMPSHAAKCLQPSSPLHTALSNCLQGAWYLPAYVTLGGVDEASLSRRTH